MATYTNDGQYQARIATATSFLMSSVSSQVIPITIPFSVLNSCVSMQDQEDDHEKPKHQLPFTIKTIVSFEYACVSYHDLINAHKLLNSAGGQKYHVVTDCSASCYLCL